jgi:PTH1 family peptidyl-tRNA hydrolase
LAVRLIVGLGNPGAKYADTRHNVGAWLLNALARQQSITLRAEGKFRGQAGAWNQGTLNGWLFIPSTFMNESGQAVQAIAGFYKIALEEILVAHDELDFPAGVIRLKAGGGHGGHNGLRDIIQRLGDSFYRLRIGIGHPGHRDQVTPYVLGEPSLHDRDKINQAIESALPIIPDLMSGEFDRAFRSLHQSDKI